MRAVHFSVIPLAKKQAGSVGHSVRIAARANPMVSKQGVTLARTWMADQAPTDAAVHGESLKPEARANVYGHVVGVRQDAKKSHGRSQETQRTDRLTGSDGASARRS